MHYGKYVFAQIMEAVPHQEFQKCVDTHRGHYRIKNFTCWDQFLAMTFGQLAYRESIRDIVACLKAHGAKRYHLGFRSVVARSTLTDANENRDWRIYRDLAQILIEQARKLYIDDPEFTLDLDGACYALDSTSIDLCLSLFKWAPYVETKGAVKVHTQMDLRGSIPTHFEITSGKVNDVNFLDMIEYENNAHYVIDRGYIDFGRLYRIHQASALFVTRAKRKMRWKRLYSGTVDRSSGLRCDQIIVLTGIGMYERYPDKLRRIKYYDSKTGHYYVFLTNDFNIDAQIVADLYKYRWKIELFFKWIKQHLKIKTFWGQSENAVKTQICIAICAYFIVAVAKKRLGIDRNLYEILQILSTSLFDKTPIKQLFSDGRLQISSDNPQMTLDLLGF
jgi:hypothetical protein